MQSSCILILTVYCYFNILLTLIFSDPAYRPKNYDAHSPTFLAITRESIDGFL